MMRNVAKLLVWLLAGLGFSMFSFAPIVAAGNEGIFDNRLELTNANFSSYSYSNPADGFQYQVADDFVLPPGNQWNVDGVRFTGVLAEDGSGLPTIGATLDFDILILADDDGKPTGTPLDPIPGTAIAWRTATATGTDTGFFSNGADFQLSFDPITLDGGTVYWIIIAATGDYTFQQVSNPTGSGWAWIGRSGFGNGWQGGHEFQNDWIDQSRQQDFSLFGSPDSKRAPVYTLIDLGDLPGGDDHSGANDINNSGQVVGTSIGATGYHAFVWDPINGMQDIGDLPGGDDYSSAYAINDNGLILGTSYTDIGERPFFFDSLNGLREIVEFPEKSFASALNNLGQVTGNYGPNGAFLWDPVNGFQDIGDLLGGYGYSEAYGVNDNGQVIGRSDTGITTHGFIWDAINGMQDLGDLTNGEDYSNALNINNLGQVIGGSSSGAVNSARAFLWDTVNGMQNLGDLPGGRANSFAYGINSHGQVVGRSRGAAWFSPFLWDSVNGMQDLNHLLDETGCGWNLGYAFAINDSGQIVGCGINPEGLEHAFLLTPIVVVDPLVAPESYLVTRGTYVAGGIQELANSDNADLSLQRASADNQSRTEFVVKATSPVAMPSTMMVSLEGSVFARSQVDQTIELFDYIAGDWEPVDIRPATRFTDLTVSITSTGDLSRFVEADTLCIEARIRYRSPIARQQFASNTDQFFWTIQ